MSPESVETMPSQSIGQDRKTRSAEQGCRLLRLGSGSSTYWRRQI